MVIDIDRVAAMGLANLSKTDVGRVILEWIDALEAERKERMVTHRGLASIPDMWHDQGFIMGMRTVKQLFDHAQTLVDSGDDEAQIETPEPAYLGATPEQPRR